MRPWEKILVGVLGDGRMDRTELLFFNSQLDSRSFGKASGDQFHLAIVDYAFEFLLRLRLNQRRADECVRGYVS